jgi:hypothetical protein
MATGFQHLHTYFLFPFSIDKQAVYEDRRRLWANKDWILGLEEWLRQPPHQPGRTLVQKLGRWRRAAYTSFNLDSSAYQDMVFFHPYVRRVFFDSADCWGEGSDDHEPLLHFYTIPLEGKTLWFEAEDAKGRDARVRITSLRLTLYANGIGILSMGVEAFDLPAEQALWINEMMRKIYPSSSRQMREGRIPVRLALVLEQGESSEVLVEERFEKVSMIGFQPPLAATIQALLHFADYQRQEFEPVLDDRMVVYTYAALDPKTIPEGYTSSEDYQILLSRLLYVDRHGSGYRYSADFVQQEMKRQLYRRWEHQGTYYGFTTYSNITCAVGRFDCDEHQLREGFLIHRMFTTRYYLMAMVTLFYRATLLDFAERTALVSRQLYRGQRQMRYSTENIMLASELRSEFLHFSNHWLFDELANKDEENEHFLMQVREYRIDVMKREIEEEIGKLNDSLHNYFQFRNTEAVNRLAMLSLIFGAGAVATGFFGMNFEGEFARRFFQEGSAASPHAMAVLVVTVFAAATLTFGFFVVLTHWRDYRESLLPRWWLARRERRVRSLKRG